MQPAEDDLAAAQVGDPLDPKPEALAAGRAAPAAGRWTRCRGRSRWSQRSPKTLGLEAVGVGHRDHDAPRRLEQAGRALERRAGAAQVLERVPEDDRGPPSLDLREIAFTEVLARRVPLESVASRPRAPSASSRVPSPTPTSRIGPGARSRRAVSGEQAPKRSEQRDRRGPRSDRPPAGTRPRRQPRARRRRGRRGRLRAAGGAEHAAVVGPVSGSEGAPAPCAGCRLPRRGGGRSCLGSALWATAVFNTPNLYHHWFAPASVAGGPFLRCPAIWPDAAADRLRATSPAPAVTGGTRDNDRLRLRNNRARALPPLRRARHQPASPSPTRRSSLSSQRRLDLPQLQPDARPGREARRPRGAGARPPGRRDRRPRLLPQIMRRALADPEVGDRRLRRRDRRPQHRLVGRLRDLGVFTHRYEEFGGGEIAGLTWDPETIAALRPHRRGRHDRRLRAGALAVGGARAPLRRVAGPAPRLRLRHLPAGPRRRARR